MRSLCCSLSLRLNRSQTCYRSETDRVAMPSQLPYIICNALNIVLNAGPLVWQFKQGNSGPIAMGVWTMIASINELVSGGRFLPPHLPWIRPSRTR